MSKQYNDARLKWIIEQEVYKLRYLQHNSGLSNSEFLQLIAQAFIDTGDEIAGNSLNSSIQYLKTREKRRQS